VRHRYGAVGQTGSIAHRALLPDAEDDHQGRRKAPLHAPTSSEARLSSRTTRACDPPGPRRDPAERFLGLPPAHLDAVPPPRGRPGETVHVAAPFALCFLDPEKRLPHLVRRAA
jgi:hypothetical protein